MLRHSKSTRLDVALVERGLVPSRTRARDLICRGFIEVDGTKTLKAAALITSKNTIRLSNNTPRYVSRGGEKLIEALDHFKFTAHDYVCLDVGASTGGFTDVLLRRGARRVIAVDVGHSQLHSSLQQRPEVFNLERTDARELTLKKIGGPVGAIVIDVSFISLLKVLPFVLPLAASHCWLITLIKPQFEVGPERIGKGGIVTDQTAQKTAVASLVNWLTAYPDWQVLGTVPSPVLGGSGNQEYLAGAQRCE